MVNYSQNNRRIVRNTIFLYSRMFIVLIINLFTARIVLNALGLVDYGIYNVVAGFVSLFGFFNATLSSSVQRFYNYDGSKYGAEGFQKIYITSLLTYTIIATLVFILLESFGLWYINNVMVVPKDRIFAVNFLFQASTLSLILMMIQIPYSGAVMAKEHMDFYAIISVVDVIFKLVIAILVNFISYDNLIIYGVLLSCISLFDLLLYVFYCKKHFVEMKLSRSFDKRVFNSMMAFSGWNLVGTFAFMMKGQGVNMLLNYFFGPVINAARGVAYQVNAAISGFSSNIYTAFGPQLVKSYAATDYNRTRRIMFLESKVCFSLIALLITPVIFEMEYLLCLWLGDVVPEYSSLFSILVLIDTLVCTLNTPCTQVIQATGKIKYYQIGSTIVNICIVPFCWMLFLLGFSSESSFIAIIIFSCLNLLVCLYMLNRQFKFGLQSYFKQIVLRCICLSILLPIIPFIIYLFLPSSLFRFILLSLSSVIYSIGVIYLCMFDKQEKIYIVNIIKDKFKK